MLVDVRGYTDMSIIGATRDDAAGECFDKTARVLDCLTREAQPLDDCHRPETTQNMRCLSAPWRDVRMI